MRPPAVVDLWESTTPAVAAVPSTKMQEADVEPGSSAMNAGGWMMSRQITTFIKFSTVPPSKYNVQSLKGRQQ